MKNKIIEYLDYLYPNPKCELNYTKDYELLIAIVLSAQTTDKRVNEVTKILFDKYKDLDELNDACLDDIEFILRPIGTYKRKSLYLKQIVKTIVNNGKCIPNDRNFLGILPGVGRKTTNVFLANIYNEDCFAVDTHVERVSKRLGIAKEKDDTVIIEDKLMEYFPKKSWSRLHHQLVLFGRYHCKARNPECLNCKLKDMCKKR